ncbi:MAG: ABC transporter ATP-binding protein, partial [Gammaproteobacteria bacterium]|nr:ABC transporter ATP-binding protein [Gammaproteobacteria bacterium]
MSVRGLRTLFATERGLVRAVDGVDLNIHKGRSLGIVGESGCGKTVLSRSIMGLLPSTAHREGSVRYEGQELVGKSVGSMRRFWGQEMSMVFQNPMVSLNPVMRIGEQIAEPLRIHLGMSRSDARDTALQLLEEVHIPEPKRRLRQYAHELSGGMRQRVVIAIALSCGPAILFADEPTTALDVTVQSQILDLIAERRQDRNMAVVLVTHDLGVVAGHTDEIAVMYAGKIVERAPTNELFANVKMPYTRSLLRSIPRLDDDPHTRLHAISGRPPDLIDPPSGCRFAPRCAYAREKCHVEAPPLQPTENPDHVYACWYP